MQKTYLKVFPDLLQFKYNEVERGRVWEVKSPETLSRKFLITCSTSVSKNLIALELIKQRFGIQNKSVEVQVQSALYDRETKIPVI